MWPLKKTAREAEIQWRWFPMAISRGSGHFRPFCVILGPLRAIFGPEHKIVANWSCDTSKWLQDKQKSDGDGFRCHFQDIYVILGNVENHKFWAQIGQKWPKKAPNDRNWPECLKNDILAWNYPSRVNEMDKGEEAMVQRKLQQKIYVKLETEKIGVLLGESCVSCLVSPSPQV